MTDELIAKHNLLEAALKYARVTRQAMVDPSKKERWAEAHNALLLAAESLDTLRAEAQIQPASC